MPEKTNPKLVSCRSLAEREMFLSYCTTIFFWITPLSFRAIFNI